MRGGWRPSAGSGLWSRTFRWRKQIRRRVPWLARFGARALLVAGVCYLLMPYWVLWRLDLALRAETPAALAPWVALDAVRDQLRRRLNKDATSSVGELSDGFIHWLEQGVRNYGTQALTHLVTLSWIHQTLRARTPADQGLRAAVRYAFFAPPRGFLVRIGTADTPPVVLLLQPAPLVWRVTAVYY